MTMLTILPCINSLIFCTPVSPFLFSCCKNCTYWIFNCEKFQFFAHLTFQLWKNRRFFTLILIKRYYNWEFAQKGTIDAFLLIPWQITHGRCEKQALFCADFKIFDIFTIFNTKYLSQLYYSLFFLDPNTAKRRLFSLGIVFWAYFLYRTVPPTMEYIQGDFSALNYFWRMSNLSTSQHNGRMS